MRDELYRRMRAKGIVLDRATYDAASRYVDQQLATEITRYVFGVEGLFTRSLTHDSVLVVAADLASRATSPADLLRLTATADCRRVVVRCSAVQARTLRQLGADSLPVLVLDNAADVP